MSNAAAANRHRGEIEAVIDGETRLLCLTLGGLAQMEVEFGAENLGELVERFSQGKWTARQLSAVIAAGLRGGGMSCDAGDVAQMQFDSGPLAAITIVTRLLDATFSASVHTGA